MIKKCNLFSHQTHINGKRSNVGVFHEVAQIHDDVLHLKMQSSINNVQIFIDNENYEPIKSLFFPDFKNTRKGAI